MLRPQPIICVLCVHSRLVLISVHQRKSAANSAKPFLSDRVPSLRFGTRKKLTPRPLPESGTWHRVRLPPRWRQTVPPLPCYRVRASRPSSPRGSNLPPISPPDIFSKLTPRRIRLKAAQRRLRPCHPSAENLSLVLHVHVLCVNHAFIFLLLLSGASLRSACLRACFRSAFRRCLRGLIHDFGQLVRSLGQFF